ncbi:MAG: endonuclease III domain-containing protein [Fervidicoccus sp.]
MQKDTNDFLREKINNALRDLNLEEGQRFIVKEVSKNFDDPFYLLISIILSQNTNDRNAIEAFLNLVERGLDFRKLNSMSLGELEEIIRISGLYKSKAETIKRLAGFLSKDELFLKNLCKKPPEEARRELTSIKGIGKKTADLFLSVYCNMPLFPVDRHIKRVTERLLDKEMDYEEVSQFWREVLDRNLLKEAHYKLIYVGRKFCRPKGEKCDLCPLADICRWRSE